MCFYSSRCQMVSQSWRIVFYCNAPSEENWKLDATLFQRASTPHIPHVAPQIAPISMEQNALEKSLWQPLLLPPNWWTLPSTPLVWHRFSSGILPQPALPRKSQYKQSVSDYPEPRKISSRTGPWKAHLNDLRTEIQYWWIKYRHSSW